MSMNAELPDQIVNLDIVHLNNLISRELQELANSTSATRNETTPADLIRMRAFLAKYSTVFEVAAEQPEPDMPKYTPRKTDHPQWPAVKNEFPLQNTEVQHVLNQWQALFVETAWSDSKERPGSFSTADETRIRDFLTRVDKAIATIEDEPEIDLPDAVDQPVHDIK